MRFLKLRRKRAKSFFADDWFRLFSLSFDLGKPFSYEYDSSTTLERKTLCQKGVHSRVRLPFNSKIQESQRRFRDYLLDNITPMGRRGRPLKKG